MTCPVCLNPDGSPDTNPTPTNPDACAALGFEPNPNLAPGLVAYDLTRGGSLFTFGAHADIKELSAYLEDSIKLGNWTIKAGVRGDHYNGLTRARQIEPRLAFAYHFPRTNTVLRASYARLLLAPFNEGLLLGSSTGAGGLSGSDFFSRQLGASENRGPSDFDIRNSTSMAVTYDIPAAKTNVLLRAISRDWSTENIFQARSATPVNVDFPYAYQFGLAQVDIRPDVVPGEPLYVYGAQCGSVLIAPCPGGKGFNPAAFVSPPIDPNTGQPTRQGDFGRNGLRGFGAWQWDFAAHRDFALGEHVKLQFRAELFNVLNHPNFAPPIGGLTSTSFGLSQQTLAQGLSSSNAGPGAFSPLYQFGGPRSAQFALKLIF